MDEPEPDEQDGVLAVISLGAWDDERPTRAEATMKWRTMNKLERRTTMLVNYMLLGPPNAA